jgi:hypothetical protein
MKSKIFNKIKKAYLLAIVAAFVLGNGLLLAPKVFALTYLVKPQIILTNMNATGSSSVIIEFTTSASNTGTSLSLTFTGWTGGAAGSVNTVQPVSANYNSIACTAITGASSYLPGVPAATGSGATVTFSGITTLTASHSYCAVLSSATAVTNPTVVNSYPAVLTSGTDAASGVAVDVITNDQVVVTATVPPSFTLVVGSNTDAFGTLSTIAANASAGVTCTLSTNGTGWYLYGIDSNAGLTSANTSHTIPALTFGTNKTISAGTEDYITGLPSGSTTPGTGGGSVTLPAAYSSSGLGNGAGLGNTQLRNLASYTVGPTSGATVVVKEFTSITGTTPAATDYTDTITLVGAGTF